MRHRCRARSGSTGQPGFLKSLSERGLPFPTLALCDWFSHKPPLGGVSGVGEDGRFITFIKMLLENQEGIIAFIKALLLIFAMERGYELNEGGE